MRFALTAVAGLAVALSSSAMAEVPSVVVDDLNAAIVESDAEVSTLTRLVMMLREMGEHAQADALLADLATSGIEIDVMHDFVVGGVLPGYENERGGIGPDVIVGELTGPSSWGVSGGIAAYSIGTTSCNIGDEILRWVSNTNQHPVIGQNIYRLKDGVFQQIGMSHLKHGFLALSGNVCSSCTGPGGSQLSPGCSDPYSSGLNGSQSGLGPKWQVNPHTGFFPYPFFSAPGGGGTIGRRLQIPVADVNPTLNAGAMYWSEGQYVTPDDAAAGNQNNNASYRRIQFSNNASFSATFIGATVRQSPAIRAWQDVDAQVNEQDVQVPGEGLFIASSRAYDNGDGTWTYAYAICNLNSDRAGQAFSIPTGANISNVGFHSPFYHSGDGPGGNTFPNTPWTFSERGSGVSWSTDTFDVNPNANALRWGTTYSYWFTSDSAPETTTATLTLFKPGEPSEVSFEVVAPAGACTLNADTNGDNVVNFADLNAVLGAFGQAGAGIPGDVNGDNVVNFSDMNAVLAEFGADCN